MAAMLATGLLLAWLPAAAWADARTISDDLCDGAYDASFDDVEGSAHEDNILCMADHDLTEGVGDGTSYGPRRDVTRGQMASFIARFLQAYTDQALPEGDPDRFEDVPADDGDYPHATSIHSLAEIEVVDGTAASDGDEYAPQALVTRAQMASMIRRALAWADDGEARNDSAPAAADEHAFTDTDGSVHEANIDAIAAEGIVQGFGDDTYRPGEVVKRDQMASFVMRSYDYALEAALGRDDDDDDDEDDQDVPDPEPGPVALLSPTTESPAFPISPGSDLTVEFQTDAAGSYDLEFRDPNPEPDTFLGFPIGGGGEGPWTDFEGDASGTVADGDTHEVTVTLPEDEPDQGVRDIRLTFVPDHAPSTTITDTQEAAIVVADGVVINLTSDRVDFQIQDAVDEAEDDDLLLAIGAFEETVTIDDTDGLMLSGFEDDTTLEGSIEITGGVEDVTIADIAISEYDTFDAIGFGWFTGDEVGVLVRSATNVTLTNLHLTGSGSSSDDQGIAISGAATEVMITDSTLVDNGTGLTVNGEDVTVTDSHLEDNGLAVTVDDDAQDITVTGNVVAGNGDGLVVGASETVITHNVFEDHAGTAVELDEGARFVELEDNEFTANDEHVRFYTADYQSGFSDAVIAENDFGDEDLEVVEDGDRTVIRAEEPAEDEEDENGDD
jgi:hypothetical protein